MFSVIACNCGELSHSMQCDENGWCPCQAGGIGDKCNECAFGFIGKFTTCGSLFWALKCNTK